VPELPEVEVVRAGLEAHVVGRVIEAVDVLHPRPVRRHVPGPEDFASALTGRTVVAARRRGKYLWLPLDNQDALVAHLGMSGQMLVQPLSAAPERHLRVRLLLSPARGADAAPAELRFVDQRMFGGLWISPGGAELPAEITHIARDPMDPEFDDDDFVRRVRKRTTGIKRLLLDQGLVSGIGNIYADEALWLAKLHGDRPGERLRRGEVVSLLAGVRTVMAAALAQGGTSFDALYVNVNGQSGYFERSLEVYGRAGEPCTRCGSLVVRVPFMNRSSYFCPRCQPPPRPRRPGRGSRPLPGAGHRGGD
jgi:formamidopyrimidine-DNA glycosylase